MVLTAENKYLWWDLCGGRGVVMTWPMTEFDSPHDRLAHGGFVIRQPAITHSACE